MAAPDKILDDNSKRLRRPKIGIRIRRRRAHSAPARIKRRSFIEDYYRVDTQENLVLPGMPTYDNDWSRDLHDFFNLIVLIPVVVLNALNWNWDVLLSPSKNTTLEEAWIGDWNNIFYRFTMFYFFLDLAWVIAVPQCVKSPVTIILHHILCLFYCTLPLLEPRAYYLMGLNMSVEANTWFLIARRVFNKQGFPPWTISLSPLFSIRIKLISIFFYLTWFVIRLFIFPSVVFKLIHLRQFYSKIEGADTTVRCFSIAVIFQLALCFLNLKWTKDLFMAKFRFWHKGKNESLKGL